MILYKYSLRVIYPSISVFPLHLFHSDMMKCYLEPSKITLVSPLFTHLTHTQKDIFPPWLNFALFALQLFLWYLWFTCMFKRKVIKCLLYSSGQAFSHKTFDAKRRQYMSNPQPDYTLRDWFDVYAVYWCHMMWFDFKIISCYHLGLLKCKVMTTGNDSEQKRSVPASGE